jgi:hypothetical protein
MSKQYLQVNYDGTIFQYSGNPKEGFVEHVNTKGKKTYRKYFNKGVDGKLNYVELKNNSYKNNAEELCVHLRGENDTYCLTFPVLNQDGTSIDEYTEAFLIMLPQLVKGEEYNINNWFMKKGDTINNEEVKYNRRGVTVKQDGKKLKTKFTFEYVKNRGQENEEHVEGDVPMLKWELIAGKNRPTAVSKETRLVYLYNILTTEVERLKYERSTEGESTNSNSNTIVEDKRPAALPQVAVTPEGDDDDDDLPF